MPLATLFPKSFLGPLSRCSICPVTANATRWAASFLAPCTHLQPWQARTKEACTLSVLDIASVDGRGATVPAGWAGLRSPVPSVLLQQPLPLLWGFLCGWPLAAQSSSLYIWSGTAVPQWAPLCCLTPFHKFWFPVQFSNIFISYFKNFVLKILTWRKVSRIVKINGILSN